MTPNPHPAVSGNSDVIEQAITSISRVLQVLDSHATLPHEFSDYDKACRAELSSVLAGLLKLSEGSGDGKMREVLSALVSGIEISGPAPEHGRLNRLKATIDKPSLDAACALLQSTPLPSQEIEHGDSDFSNPSSLADPEAINLTTLTQERDALREALKPFADYYDLNDCDGRTGALEVPIADLRRARKALTGERT